MATTAGAEGNVDGGTPAFTLFDDYGCPNALPMTRVDGGWWASDARKARIDCALTGAQAELGEWRPKKGAETAPSTFTLLPSHGVLATASALVTAYLAVVTSRAQRNCRGTFNPFGSC